MNRSRRDAIICPACGAINQVDETTCFLCDRVFDAATIDPRQNVNDIDSESNSSVYLDALNKDFTIASLMLFIALVAVCLGAFHIAPELGIAAVFFAVPAFMRTRIVSKSHRLRGLTFGPLQKGLVFIGSFFVCVGVPIVLICAFAVSMFIAYVVISGLTDPVSITIVIVISICFFFKIIGFFIVGTVRWFRYK